ncbi:uncharacterized protein [Musca autumnalis]|uniref:uncharacterized protein n=1 Tax=Musca autumnalis TaxID=221902 RepID=UPI003CEE49E5
MTNYKEFFTSRACHWLMWSITLIFITALCTFTILEVKSVEDETPSVIRIILNTITHKGPGAHGKHVPTNNQFVLVNVEALEENKEEILKAIAAEVEEQTEVEDHTEVEEHTEVAEQTEVPQQTEVPEHTEVPEQPTEKLERKVRDVRDSTATNVNNKNNSYYEEQTPVVVYSKTDQEAPLSYRQSAPVPYEQGSHEEQPYYDDSVNGDYSNDDSGYYRPQYDDDSREDFPGPQDYQNDQYTDQARSSQSRPYDSYYRQWHYATPSPVAQASSSSLMATQGSQGNRKLQSMTSAPTGDKHRDPYSPYGDDVYDYTGYRQRSPQYQQQQSYPPAPAINTGVQKQKEEGNEMNFITILKTIKAMWDLYQSFISAWNSMAEHHNKQEELNKQKYEEQLKQQQKLKVNSKKPPKSENKKKQENAKKQAATRGPSTKLSTTTQAANVESSTENEGEATSQNKAKVEPRKVAKGEKTVITEAEGLRTKRQATSDSTDVGEGRYIKGDPLKGYYDFVITEGSYKFWAAFQVGTALLIIYSTFAAIYYSKVNPLVSDYDYTDYLGGGRSLSGGDLDFVDDETTAEDGVKHSKGWLDWLPRTGHSLKFILDAIDKLPLDHDVAEEANGNVAGWLDNTNDKENSDESSNNKAM